jgi:UDP-N-acetylmuramyl pentapeptide phosphotransferase/UDP-N-acetylglucosamine-1-phosphate transferase
LFFGSADLLLMALALVVPFLVLVLAMPTYLGFLKRRGMVVDDVHKQPPTKVPSPAGPIIFLAAVIGEIVVYVAYGTLVPLAIIGTAAVAFVIGLWDDLSVLGGITKPALLLLAAAPLVASVLITPNLYEPRLTFPILGPTGEHFTIYTILVVAAFPVVANAFNMMDSFNGELSGFTFLSTLALTFGVVLHAYATSGFSLARVGAALPLLAVSAGFHLFNRHPSRAFDGNSGSHVFGAMFAALAITGGVEVAAIVAMIPAILNSFYILSSVRGFVERRRMSARPTSMKDDGRLYATPDSLAPTTLARLVLLAGPLSEKGLVREILELTAVTCVLSVLTSMLTWVV